MVSLLFCRHHINIKYLKTLEFKFLLHIFSITNVKANLSAGGYWVGWVGCHSPSNKENLSSYLKIIYDLNFFEINILNIKLVQRVLHVI